MWYTLHYSPLRAKSSCPACRGRLCPGFVKWNSNAIGMLRLIIKTQRSCCVAQNFSPAEVCLAGPWNTLWVARSLQPVSPERRAKMKDYHKWQIAGMLDDKNCFIQAHSLPNAIMCANFDFTSARPVWSVPNRSVDKIPRCVSAYHCMLLLGSRLEAAWKGCSNARSRSPRWGLDTRIPPAHAPTRNVLMLSVPSSPISKRKHRKHSIAGTA